ncbi:helix-turn-helix domain-containing protein [Hydrocarboniphaga effusa]|uniref:helix-turn-helix domain-containing protein n=1 Tax=Hydrocarboniphaga effusa TaxID=243629 RepID=UPI00398C1120
MEAEQAFGQVLRELRKQKGLSQEQLALEADLQRNYVSLLERGLNSATLKTLFKLSPILEVSVSAMLGQVESRLIDRRTASKKR